MAAMTELEEIRHLIREFRDARDWMQFHNPKNLACSISIEANELLEHFQWKTLAESLVEDGSLSSCPSTLNPQLSTVFCLPKIRRRL